jgi:hypothetical protein
LTGSSTTGLILPINGMLEELRLPSTINTINIESHPKLTADKFSVGTYDYGTATKIGEGNGYINDYSGITHLYVVDTPINTYDIITTPRSSLEAYHLQNIHWDITAVNELYCEVSEEEFKANPSEHYYYYDSRQQQYTDYIFTNYP